MHLSRLLGAALAASVFGSPAIAAPPPDLDAFVAQALQTFGPPGMSVAIVEGGKPVLAKGYGIRKLGSAAPVDAHTIFPIGSESKAFTAAALAILVDQGKLKWDDRVLDRLPGFQMYDSYATEHMTVRDLLTHRSGLGLGEGDLLIVPGTTRSRADIVHALRYLKPVTGFRESFAYDNILYIVAGALVESVSGETWQHFVQAHILTPAGMTDAATSYDPNAANGIGLHARTDGAIQGIGRLRILPRGLDDKTAGPAGGINASATDMATWMQTQLAAGLAPNGARIFSEIQGKAMWTPVVTVADSPVPVVSGSAMAAALSPAFQDYGLGWFIEDYHGHTVIEHTGAVLGAVAALYLIPEKKVGIAVMINSEDGAARRAVAFHLLDHYLGLPDQHWNTAFKALIEGMNAKAQKAVDTPPTSSATIAAPSLPLASYAGVYRDPWYGTATVSLRDGKPWLRFDMTPDMEAPLVPVGGDIFRADWTDRTIEAAYVAFVLDKGKIASVNMRPVSPLADFSFDYKDLAFVPVQ